MYDLIQPVSNPTSGAATSLAAAEKAASPAGPRAAEQAPVRAQRPNMDAYVPEEKQESSGRYWPGRDENGQPKIYFDGPKPSAEPPDTSEAPDGAPQKPAAEKAERCTANTDAVDREIEHLRQKKEALERQIRAQTDDAKAKALVQKLAQVERELRQKDNDAYRRQHTVFSSEEG